MNRYVCIHGHFYEPPRENPWLEKVELQESAYPHHDWNERITAECYAPNSAARILDAEKKIVDILDNCSRISFNFGPTLLSWLERRRPAIYESIVEADHTGRKRFSGHGPAMAQVYNHMIMPLASNRDKRAQVRCWAQLVHIATDGGGDIWPSSPAGGYGAGLLLRLSNEIETCAELSNECHELSRQWSVTIKHEDSLFPGLRENM